MTCCRLFVFPPVVCLFLGLPLPAAPKITVPAVKDSRIDNLLPVTAPDARCAALNDTTGWLAFGHRPTYKKAHVSLYRLDAQGKPAAAVATTLKLPLPAALAKYPNYPLGLAFHPKLPLLYVWQDIEYPFNAAALPEASLKEFDHLLIYSLEKAVPELVVSWGRGPEFAYARTAGDVAVDSAGKYLYVPNLLNPKEPTLLKVGRYDLDADGLPLWDDKAAAKGAAKAARMAAVNAAKAAGKPILPDTMTPVDSTYTYPNVAHGCGYSFIPVAPKTVIFGSGYSVQFWDPSSRNLKITALLLGNVARPYFIAAHPKRPAVYVTVSGQNYALRVFHADGHFSLLPQTATFTDANLLSPPVVMGGGSKVAFGGYKRVYVVTLDKKGNFTAERVQAVVDNPTVEAMGYSAKFDRLYVPVEVSK